MPTVVTASRNWSRREKLTARRLYLIQGESPSEIAERLGKSSPAVWSFLHRQGWTELRRKAEVQAAEAAEREALRGAEEFRESLAVRGQELAERGMDLAEGAADTHDAKGFAMAMQGAKVAVGFARFGLGIEAASGDASGNSARPLAIVFAMPSPDPEPRNVTPLPAAQDLGEILDFD